MTTSLSGPVGGEWVHTTATMRDVPTRCNVCGELVQDVWQYFVGPVSHARVCVDCAATLTNAEEATMTSTTIRGEIALALDAANEDWAQGRAASPDTRDFVLIAERILSERLGPEYLYLAGDTRELIADDMYERQSGGELSEWAEMADYLVDRLTAEYEGEVV